MSLLAQEITIGNYTATGSDVTVNITGTGKDGTKKTKSYKFTKKIVSSEYPTLSKGGVAFDNSGYNWAKVYCYAYNDSGTTAVNNGSWPGVLMNDEGTGFFTYEFPSTLTGTVKVIFSNGSGVPIPASGQPGLAMNSTDKKLFKNDKLNELPASVKSLSVKLTPSTTNPGIGQTVTFTASAQNVSGTANYTFLLNDGTTLKASSTSNTCTWTPSKAGTYIAAVKAKDSKLSVTAAAKIVVSSTGKLISESSVSSGKIAKGGTVTLYGKASGGAAPYQYCFCYKRADSSNFAKIQDYSTTATATLKPASATKYVILIKVKDKNGSIAKSTFDLTVTSGITNTSTVSATRIAKGSSVNVTLSATGGAGGYSYGAWYRKEGYDNWVSLQSYGSGTSVAFKPSSTGTYELLTKVKDKNGSIGRKSFTITVTGGLSNTSKISAASIKLGSAVTVTASASGGKTPYQYAVLYKKSASEKWSVASKYTAATTTKIKPSSATSYDILVKVKDASGKIAKKTFTVKVTK